VAARLTHPNAVQLFAAGEEDAAGAPSVQYLVMEYVEGETLADIIRARGRLPEIEALDIVRRLAGALAEAAELGIIHRDVKPSNVLVSRWGVPKLADFGIAKHVADIPDPAIQLSLTLGVVGTPAYMSPEQARGARDLDLRSDIHSLGATLYHMVLGSVPFGADTPQETMVRVVSEAPRPPLTVDPDLSEETGAVLCRMMAKDAAARYPSYEALCADLDAVLDGGEPSVDYDEAIALLRPPPADDADLASAAGGGFDATDPLRIALVALGVAILGLLVVLGLKGC
jgi:serine/threonine-protein kinase